MRYALFLAACAALFALPLAAQVVNVNVPVVGATSYPFVANSQVQTWWVPSQLGNPSGPVSVTEFGLQFANPVSRTFTSCTIYMGETTVTQTTMNTTFDNNWFTGTKTLVYTGSITVNTTTTNEHWRVTLQTPYSYSCTRGLMVHIIWAGTSTGTGTVSHCADFSTTTQSFTTRCFNATTTATTGSINPACVYGASFNFVPPGPIINTSVNTLNLGTTTQGTAGSTQTYTVSGVSTTASTTITRPSANVEIKQSTSSTWGATVVINNTGNWGPFTIDVRIAAGASVGTISGDITHVSTGATTKNVTLSGNVVPTPVLAVNPGSLNLGTTSQGVAGSTQSYQINGTNTVAQTDITAPAGVEVSLNQTTWAQSVSIATTGTWANTTVYARIAASASVGAISGNITNATSGATTQNVSVSGNVNPPPSLVATPNSLNLGSTPQGLPGAEDSYNLVGSNLTTDTVITPPAGVEISLTSGGTFTNSITITTIPSFNVDIFVRLTGATVGAVAGDITNVSGSASQNVAITGNVTQNLNLIFVRNGPAASTSVDNDDQGAGGNGLVILDLSVSAGTDPFTLTDITFTESGSADGQADINFIGLYEDSGNGTWDDPATDTLATAATGAGFNGPNGDYTAALTNTAVAASTTRRFFLLVKLAATATAGETIQAEVTAATANTAGTGTTAGIPTSGANPALTINAATLAATFNGPAAFTTVDSASQGAGNNGHVILDVTLTATNDSWTVTSMTFTASGTADEQADINFLALYVDNGNGTFDGPGTDTLATAAAGTSFNAPNGTYTATLTGAASAFGMNATKRFFLVARLAGTATSGETFRAALTSMVQTSPSAGTVTGVPTVASSALVIDVATLTVNAGPSNPADTYIEFTGAGFTHTLGEIRLSASNDNFTVSGVTLTLQGNGDWVNNVSQLRVYLDNGNGTFDVADTQLFAGATGATSVACAFSTNVTINAGTSSDLWVVIDLAATAGGSPSESFNARIQSPADVQQVTAGNVLIGSMLPISGTLHVIVYALTGFTPLQDAFAGGAFITITGSGFAAPISCTINGVPCNGTATADATGTTITGLRVPQGSGQNLTIVLTTNNLGPKTLTQTFSYNGSILISGGGKGGGGGGCETSNTGTAALLAALSLLALAATLRRRRA